MKREEVSDLLIPLLGEYTGRAVEARSLLQDDLDLDSLDAVQVLSELEDAMGRDLAFQTNDQLRKLKTVDDLTDLVLASLTDDERAT